MTPPAFARNLLQSTVSVRVTYGQKNFRGFRVDERSDGSDDSDSVAGVGAEEDSAVVGDLGG